MSVPVIAGVGVVGGGLICEGLVEYEEAGYALPAPGGIQAKSVVLAKYKELRTQLIGMQWIQKGSGFGAGEASPKETNSENSSSETPVPEDAAAAEAAAVQQAAEAAIAAAEAAAKAEAKEQAHLEKELVRLEVESRSRSKWEARRATAARKEAVKAAEATVEAKAQAARLELELIYANEAKARAAKEAAEVDLAVKTIEEDCNVAIAAAAAARAADLDAEYESLARARLATLDAEHVAARASQMADAAQMAAAASLAAIRRLKDLEARVEAAFLAAEHLPADDLKAKEAHLAIASAVLASDPEGLAHDAALQTGPSIDTTKATAALRDRWRQDVLRAARVAAQTPEDLGVLGAALGSMSERLRFGRAVTLDDMDDLRLVESANAAIADHGDLAVALDHLGRLPGDETKRVVADWRDAAAHTLALTNARVALDARAKLIAASRANLPSDP